MGPILAKTMAGSYLEMESVTPSAPPYCTNSDDIIDPEEEGLLPQESHTPIRDKSIQIIETFLNKLGFILGADQSIIYPKKLKPDGEFEESALSSSQSGDIALATATSAELDDNQKDRVFSALLLTLSKQKTPEISTKKSCTGHGVKADHSTSGKYGALLHNENLEISEVVVDAYQTCSHRFGKIPNYCDPNANPVGILTKLGAMDPEKLYDLFDNPQHEVKKPSVSAFFYNPISPFVQADYRNQLYSAHMQSSWSLCEGNYNQYFSKEMHQQYHTDYETMCETGKPKGDNPYGSSDYHSFCNLYKKDNEVQDECRYTAMTIANKFRDTEKVDISQIPLCDTRFEIPEEECASLLNTQGLKYFKQFPFTPGTEYSEQYKTAQCDHIQQQEYSAGHTRLVLGGVSLALTVVLNTIPTAIYEAQNLDESMKDWCTKAAMVARFAIMGIALAPPAALIAGASPVTLAAISGVSSGASCLQTLGRISTNYIKARQATNSPSNHSDAAQFINKNRSSDNCYALTKDGIKAIIQALWTTQHAMEVLEQPLPILVRRGLMSVTLLQLLGNARKHFQGTTSTGPSMLHQAMRGDRQPVMISIMRLIQPLNADDEKNILKEVNGACIAYIFGGNRLNDKQEKDFFAMLFSKLCQDMKELESIWHIIDRIYSFNFSDFDMKNKKMNSEHEGFSQDIQHFFIELAELRLLDKLPLIDSRGGFDASNFATANPFKIMGSFGKTVIEWNCNAVYDGLIAPIVCMLEHKQNPSVVINIPEETQKISHENLVPPLPESTVTNIEPMILPNDYI